MVLIISKVCLSILGMSWSYSVSPQISLGPFRLILVPLALVTFPRFLIKFFQDCLNVLIVSTHHSISSQVLVSLHKRSLSSSILVLLLLCGYQGTLWLSARTARARAFIARKVLMRVADKIIVLHTKVYKVYSNTAQVSSQMFVCKLGIC